MENDPTARVDLERFMDDLVPEDYPYFVHTIEGPDDMPSHIKMTAPKYGEPAFSKVNWILELGRESSREHRISPHNRKLVITAFGE